MVTLPPVNTWNPAIVTRHVFFGQRNAVNNPQRHDIITAAQTGDVEKVQKHLNDVDVTTADKEDAMIEATKNNRLECLRILLDHGIDPNGDGFFKCFPLCKAAYGGHLEVVNLLLSNGASVNTECSRCDGYTPLQQAAMCGHTDIVEVLCVNGANCDRSCYYYQCSALMLASGSYPECMKILLNHSTSPVNYDSGDGRTALYQAVNGRDPLRDEQALASVKLLLANGAKASIGFVNREEMGDTTPILIAAKNNKNAAILKCLIDAGADINAPDRFEDWFTGTPLMRYFENGNIDCVKLLIDYGCNVNGRIPWGLPPLQSMSPTAVFLLKHSWLNRWERIYPGIDANRLCLDIVKLLLNQGTAAVRIHPTDRIPLNEIDAIRDESLRDHLTLLYFAAGSRMPNTPSQSNKGHVESLVNISQESLKSHMLTAHPQANMLSLVHKLKIPYTSQGLPKWVKSLILSKDGMKLDVDTLDLY